MAAPLLRHIVLTSVATGTASTPAVPAGRALVVGKLTVTVRGQSTGTHYVNLWVGGANGDAEILVQNFALAPGELFTESGLVVPAGERVWLTAAVAVGGGLVGGVYCQVFGEEVDN